MKNRNKTENNGLLNEQQDAIQNKKQSANFGKNKLKTETILMQNNHKKQTSKTFGFQKNINSFALLMSKTNQGATFAKAKRTITERTTFDWRPSPHQYHYQSCQTKKRSPKFSFAKEQKFFKSKKQQKLKTQIPGPGKYQTNSLQKIIGDVIGQQIRMSKLINAKNPGVGQYQIERKSNNENKGIRFQKSSRGKLQKINCYPGPNQYEVSKSTNLKNYKQSFGRSKRIAEILSQAPGIGSYKIQNYKKRHSTSVRFSTSPRQYNISKQKQCGPGPGNYQVASIIKFKKNCKLQSVIFGNQDRQNKITQGPGPGTYDVYKKNQNKGISLTGRNFYNHIEKGPSPNAYSPDFTKIIAKAQTARMGKQDKLKQSCKIIPGPSYYEPERSQKLLLKHIGFVFPKSSRQKSNIK